MPQEVDDAGIVNILQTDFRVRLARTHVSFDFIRHKEYLVTPLGFTADRQREKTATLGINDLRAHASAGSVSR